MTTFGIHWSQQSQRAADAQTLQFFKEGMAEKSLEGFVFTENITDSYKDYEFYGGVSPVERWTGEPLYKGFDKYTHTVRIDDYQNGFAFKVNDIKDGKVPMPILNSRLQMGMRKWTTKFANELLTLRINGGTDKCFDGQAFYSNAHPDEAGTTYSNDYTGSGTTVANLKTDLISVKKGILSIVDRAGDPIFSDGEFEIQITHSIDYIDEWEQVLDSIQVDGGSGELNRFAGKAKHKATKRISGGTWYFDIKTPDSGEVTVFPYMLIMREAPKGNWIDDKAYVLQRKQYYYQIDGRFGTAYGNPAYAGRVNN